MNFIRFVINRKIFVGMLFLGLSMLGIVSYRQLPLELMPNVEYPYLIVQVTSTSAVSPEYMEKLAVIPIEGAISTLDGISAIETSIQRRRGTIYLYFNQGVSLEYAYLKLEEKLSRIISSLSGEFRINIVKVDEERISNVFMRLQVRGSGGLERVRAVIDNSILEDLESIDGISSVNVTGGQVMAVEIILNDDAVQAYRISPSRISSLLRQNSERKSFVGHTYEAGKQYFVNVVSDYIDVSNLEDIVVDPAGPVMLRDVADIVFGVKEPESISRVNGKDAVTIQLSRDANVNLIELSHFTREVIDRLNRELAYQDIELVIQSDSSEEMENNIDLIMWLAMTGGILAVIILWFFMKNLRLVLTVMLSIPVSIIISFNLFYAFGITLNSLTLVGMILAIGMLLDNSIVVLENIYRHHSHKKDRDEAVIIGTHEVWRSITAATLTTITVFLPFLFSTNYLITLVGRQIGVSIISTLVVSLFAALLLVPMLTHKFLGRSKLTHDSGSKVSRGVRRTSLRNNRLMQIYTLLLKTTIRYPAYTVLTGVVVFFVSISLCLSLSRDVPTAIELRQFNLYVTMPEGSTLDATSDVVEQLERTIEDIPEINERISTIYEEDATITVALLDDFEEQFGTTVQEIKELIEERIEDFNQAEVSLTEAAANSRFSSGRGSDPVASLERLFGIGPQQERILIKGNDYGLLRSVADGIEYNLGELEYVSDIRVNAPRNTPEIHLLFDQEMMNQHDVAISTVGVELASFESEVSSGMTFRQGAEEYEIIIRSRTLEEEKTFDDLKELPIESQSGGFIDLERFSRIIYSYGISGINRVDQRKQIEVTYNFPTEINESKTLLESSRNDIEEMLSYIPMPADVAIEVVRDVSEFEEFYFLIGAAFILIYMILASVFQSLTTPFVMMLTIPLATIGSFWALILTGNSLFNANSLIGFLILLGVVVNNGIILIDYTNILRKRGFRRSRALLTAGQARVRPILITAITTIVAMIPLAMGRAEYVSRIGAPFAITVIGGLALSTVFTLLFVPAVYSGLENALNWMRNLGTKTKVLQLAIFTVLCGFIYYNVSSLLWQMGYLLLTVVAVPGVTWFFKTSLRQARSDIIKPDERLKLNFRRMVKIYGDTGRFVREWQKGERMKARIEAVNGLQSGNYFSSYMWLIPVFAFLVYFVYYYIESNAWLFILSFAVYFYLDLFFSPFAKYFKHLYKRSGKARWRKLSVLSIALPRWIFPAVSLAIFYFNFFEERVLLFIGLAWYSTLIVVASSRRLRSDDFNSKNYKGWFALLRRFYYGFIQIIPFAGRRQVPFQALEGVSIDMENGMFGLIGPNGAGKTTLMRIICGILTQSRGTGMVNEINVNEQREEIQGLIGYLPQEFGFYENMTACEFLDYMAILKSMYDKEKRNHAVIDSLEKVHLSEHRNKKIKTFSGGMKQRLGIAMTLIHLPRILVVDEPTAGLDPRERIRFRNLMVELSRDRVVIYSTHIIEDISRSCNKVAVLDKGKLFYMGDPRNMVDVARGKVWQFYAGMDEFDAMQDGYWIIHHMRVEDKIRVRCLSDSQPHDDAEPVTPTMEDAYLWLLGRKESSEYEVSFEV